MSMRAKRAGADQARFEGNGVSYKAKLIGIETVPEARGDQMCQEAITKLKNSVRISGQHKQKIFVNVTLEGLKIIDAISLAAFQSKKKNEAKGGKESEENEQAKEKEEESLVLHTHQVHRISFISRDISDSRAFGYVYGEGDGSHKFFAIKTAAAAEHLVLTLRDLFQVVYEMKKKEMAEAKEKMEKGEVSTDSSEENLKTSGDGSTSGNAQTPATATADSENIYSVPPNNAPVNPESRAEEVAANLLDLEDQAEHILKGIEQIKNLDFDSVTDDPGATSPVSPPTSPIPKLSTPAQSDPWGAPAANAPAQGTSSLGDLAGLQTNAFPAMAGGMAQPGTPFPAAGFGAQPSFNPMAGGLPVTRDPFGTDPFSATAAAARPPSGPGFAPAANPFGAPAFGVQPGMPAMAAPGMMPGMMAQPGMMPGQPGMMAGQPGMMPGVAGMGNPFAMAGQPAAPQGQFMNAFGNEDPNLLTPIKKDGGNDEQNAASDTSRSKSPRADLFGDLVDIKKEKPAPEKSNMTVKELFAQQNATEKKSMNELMATKPPGGETQASCEPPDPFGELSSIETDKTRSLLSFNKEDEDPFDTSHIPSLPPPAPPAKAVTNSPPPVPRRTIPPVKDLAQTSPAPSSTPPPLPPPTLPAVASRGINPEKLDKTPTDIEPKPSASSNSSFMLPSPDEPPPPLPAHLSVNAPPPPPPRPKSSSSQSSFTSTLSSPHLHHSFSTQSINTPPVDSTGDNRKESPRTSSHIVNTLSSTDNQDSDIALKWNKIPSAISMPFDNSPFDHDPFCVPLKSNTPKKSAEAISKWSPQPSPSPRQQSKFKDPFAHTNPASDNKDLNFNDSFSPQDGFANTTSSIPTSSSGKVETKSNDPFAPDKPSGKDDDFDPREESQISSTLSKDKENDPFGDNAQLHDSFKVTAKYGNDPFEDSFTGTFTVNGSDTAWNPFPEVSDSTSKAKPGSDIWDSSPFGDAFAPAPVNGNSSGGNSLLG